MEPATDFSKWDDSDIKAFLDQRGEDYDDCVDSIALHCRARECEENTGRQADLSAVRQAQTAAAGANEEEPDPLQAFMDEIADAAVAEEPQRPDARRADTGCDGSRGDELDSYIATWSAAREGPAASGAPSSAPGGSLAVSPAPALDDAKREEAGRGQVDPLPAIDHAQQAYGAFRRSFYDESPELFALEADEVQARRAALEVRVSGARVPAPIADFDQCGFPDELRQAVAAAGFAEPTAIQAQVLPVALSGQDVVGLAATGSGKTAAFLLPLIVHVAAQRRADRGEGPAAIVLAPTRELAQQIHQECRRLAKALRLRVVAAFGGLQKYAQTVELKKGSEVAIATPGRLIELVRSGACPLQRVTLVVVDEVDRCLDLGFEQQVMSIINHTRPDRQALLFSATLPARAVRVVRAATSADAVHVTMGAVGRANAEVSQSILLMANANQKMQWLEARLQDFVNKGEVLLFVNARSTVVALLALVQGWGVRAAGLHGDMDQHARMSVLAGFKAQSTHVLVATDVAARGLDIRSVRTVICYDTAKSIDAHVHRIGRTGRAHDKDSLAVTLILPHETAMAAALAQNLRDVGQAVPQAVLNLAQKAVRSKDRAGRTGVGGGGLGFDSSNGCGPQSLARGGANEHDSSAAGGNEGNALKRGAPDPVPDSKRAHVDPGSSWNGQRAPAAPVGTQSARPPPRTAHVPRGFVPAGTVGGGDERPSIVMPKQQARQDESPASWLQKRIVRYSFAYVRA